MWLRYINTGYLIIIDNNNKYKGGTRVLSSAGDVFEMSVVRGESRVCDMCMCLARGGVLGVSG